jgi:hypothetical protein
MLSTNRAKPNDLLYVDRDWLLVILKSFSLISNFQGIRKRVIIASEYAPNDERLNATTVQDDHVCKHVKYFILLSFLVIYIRLIMNTMK